MSAAPNTIERIQQAIAGLSPGPLTEAGVARHIAPLFSRVLARDASRLYLANHSLGRPLDAMEDDVREALAVWYSRMGGAWDAWSAELSTHRARWAGLLGVARSDCIVPKTSAGAGLRAVLSSYEGIPNVVATRGEFDSLDVIVREYARRKRVALTFVEGDGDERFSEDAIERAIVKGTDLVVVSHVMFKTGQLLSAQRIVARAHAVGAKVLLDVYHAVGVVPENLAALNVDFAVGGSYKYLRGGPGACVLYVAPRHLDTAMRTLDIGWFAKEAAFSYARPDPPRFATGGDGWMESTPPVLTWYQARSGLAFTLAIGVDRLRAYSLHQQRTLVDLLHTRGIAARGGREDHGAFVVVTRDDAVDVAAALGRQDIDVDARGRFLRICPDLLTTREQLEKVANALSP
ncbi:MAG TPA: aminotransferase class V-fold PLP-dependent enzyme [Casimicrobiaceae bacterium]|nr:aminotransferase class V-fold PLP-dependent enzyme [Casimicrobiaceae bacterium]